MPSAATSSSRSSPCADGERGGFVVERRVIGRDGDVDRRFGLGDALDGARDLVAAAVELLAELRDQRVDALRFGALERRARVAQHQQLDQPDGRDDATA